MVELGAHPVVLSFPLHIKNGMKGKLSLGVDVVSLQSGDKLYHKDLFMFFDERESLLDGGREFFLRFTKDDYAVFNGSIKDGDTLGDKFLMELYMSVKNNGLNNYEVELMKKYKMIPITTSMMRHVEFLLLYNYLVMGEMKKASELVAKLDNKTEELMNLKAYFYMLRGKYAKSERILNSLMEKDVRFKRYLRFNLAVIYTKMKKNSEAKKLFRLTIDENPCFYLAEKKLKEIE